MPMQIHQTTTDLSVCICCDIQKTIQCALCKEPVCAAHRVKVQGYAAEGVVDMCQACAKYIETIVAPKYSQ